MPVARFAVERVPSSSAWRLVQADARRRTTQAISEPVVTAPMVLNSAPGSTVAPTALAPAPARRAWHGGGDCRPRRLPSRPAAVATNRHAQPVAAAPAEPLPTARAGGVDRRGVPQHQQVPTQPSGTLLPKAERARIIAELEALRAKQPTGGVAGGRQRIGPGRSGRNPWPDRHPADRGVLGRGRAQNIRCAPVDWPSAGPGRSSHEA